MRLIDADALRKCFEVPHELKCGIQAGMDEYALKCIDEQPTIPAPRWHRVEEKMPEDGETVLIYGRMKYEWEKEYEYFEDAAEYLPSRLRRAGGWVTWNDWYEGQHHFEILYWMPLPEPPGEEV